MHDAFAKHKIYEYPGIKSAAIDADFLANIATVELKTNRALEEKNVDPNNKFIAVIFKDNADKWSRKEIYE